VVAAVVKEERVSFRAKGLVYQGARDYYEEVVPGGWNAVVSQLSRREEMDPRLRAFCSEPFVAGGWYDAMPIVSLSRAAAALSGVPHPQFVRDNSAWLARRDLRGVYKVILQLASIELVALRLPGLSLRYFDFGSADAKMISTRVMRSVRAGVPASMASWFAWAIEGFTPAALELAGARQVRVRAEPPALDGEIDGVALARIPVTVSWG
jgi:hypothetical protein